MLSFLYSPTFISIHDDWKTIALTRRTFVGKVMSLLFNMLSRLVTTFLPRSKRLLISWLQSPSAVILEPRKINSQIHQHINQFPYSVLNFWLYVLNIECIYLITHTHTHTHTHTPMGTRQNNRTNPVLEQYTLPLFLLILRPLHSSQINSELDCWKIT